MISNCHKCASTSSGALYALPRAHLSDQKPSCMTTYLACTGEPEDDGLHGDKPDDNSEDASRGTGVELGDGTPGTNDFTRGKRLRKLLRLLNSKAAMQAITDFSNQMYVQQSRLGTYSAAGALSAALQWLHVAPC